MSLERKKRSMRDLRFMGACFHMLSLVTLVLGLIWMVPSRKDTRNLAQATTEQSEKRQRLLEALDRIVRYEHYHREVFGKFTRDLSRLALPARMSSGSWEQVQRDYEISVVEMQPHRLLVLATSVDGKDRITINERFRMSANFILPSPARAYLLEEGERLLRLGREGKKAEWGAYLGYWVLTKEQEGELDRWIAVGKKTPVLGEKQSGESRGLASLFSAVRAKMEKRLGNGIPGAYEAGSERKLAATPTSAASQAYAGETLTDSDLRAWLKEIYFAQHIHKREHGFFATRWEDLDLVTGYAFSERKARAENVRVQPIEVVGRDQAYTVIFEGTKGDLLGEQYVLNEKGDVRQLRYTDALIHQLQESTQLLENAFNFQISELPGENPKLDGKDTSPVKSKN